MMTLGAIFLMVLHSVQHSIICLKSLITVTMSKLLICKRIIKACTMGPLVYKNYAIIQNKKQTLKNLMSQTAFQVQGKSVKSLSISIKLNT